MPFLSIAPMLPLHGVLRTTRRNLQPAKMRAAVKRIADAILPRWDACLRNALQTNEPDVDFSGLRVSPQYVARQFAQVRSDLTGIPESIERGELDAEIASEIVSAAQASWVYRDRSNRG